jgi:CheY-like chemotaxis protein
VAASYELNQELRGIRILAVDDEEDNVELVRYMLETAGAEVSTADSAEKALELLETGKFDLMISDIGLPDQDGLHLMREVRARGFAESRLPAIALTGYAGNHDVRLVKAAGYQRHLAKPVDATDLLRAAVELVRAKPFTPAS